MLEVAGGNKHEVADAQGRFSSSQTVDSGWVITTETGEPGGAWRREKSWDMMDPDLDTLQYGWKVALCESCTGHLLRAADLNRRILLKKAPLSG